MTDIILFRYHRAYDVCVQTLQLLRKLNPDTPIHGLYGGNDLLEDIPSELTSLLDSNWAIPIDDFYYKWKNGDLCVRWWFREKGRDISFDHAYFLEWDMLLFKPLSVIYGPLDKDTNYSTIFGDFDYARSINWYWIREQFGVETDQLLEHLAERGKAVDIKSLSFSTMGGAVFCRGFLELYSNEPVPCYSNDELRLSVYSKAFNIPLKNNFIADKARRGLNLYSADGAIYTEDDVNAVLSKNGDLIHPIRIVIDGLDRKINEQIESLKP